MTEPYFADPTAPAVQSPSPSRPTGFEHTSAPSNHSSPSPPTKTAPSPLPTQPSSTPETPYTLVPMDAIDLPDPTTARTTPNDQRVATLAANIREIGLLNPITLRHRNSRYFLIAGLGRYLACRLLNWQEIPAHILQGNDHTAALATLSENVTRTNLNPAEEAIQLSTLVEAHPEGTVGVAQQLGRSQAWVEDRLDILTWPEQLIHEVAARRISLAAAKHLARITDPSTQAMYIRDAAENGITARTAAIWKQAAETAHYEPNDASEKSVPQPLSPMQTTTVVQCFGCRELKDINDTQPGRICSACCLQLGTAPNIRTNVQIEPTLAATTMQPPAPSHHPHHGEQPHHHQQDQIPANQPPNLHYPPPH